MLKRLTRILLALVTAFVFFGQMEAAAEHCVRLAKQTSAAHEPATADEPPCHQANAAMHHGDGAPPAHHKTPDRCECIAALKMCGDVVEAKAATHIEPYVWLAPQEAHFASRAPEPGWRPPRA